MGRQIDITLGLKDNLTGALRNAVREGVTGIDRLQDKLSKLHSPGIKSPVLPNIPTPGTSQGIGVGGIVTGNVIADALGAIASGILSAGQGVIDSFASAYKSAEEANKGQLSAASNISVLMDKSYAQGKSIATKATEQLAGIAKSLPGATKDYQDTFTGLSDTLSQASLITENGLKESGLAFVRGVTLMAKDSGKTTQQMSTDIGKLMSEGASKALFNNDTFANNPVFQATLTKNLTKAGKGIDDFFKMSIGERTEFVNKSMGQIYSPEKLSEMATSATSRLDTVMADLFDPNAGVFGFLKTIKLDGIDTSVFGQVNLTMGKLIDFGTKLASIVFPDGVGGILESLAGGIQRVGLWAEQGTKALASIQNIAPFDSLLNFISSGGIVQGLMSGLGSVMNSIGTGLAASLNTVDYATISTRITYAVLKGMEAVTMSISTGFIGGNEGLNSLMMTAFNIGGQILFGTLVGIGSYLADRVTEVWTIGTSAVSSTISSGLSTLGEYVSGRFGELMGVADGLIGQISSAISSVMGAIASTISSVISAIQSIPIPGIGSGSPVKARYSGQHMDRLQAFTGNTRFDKVGTASMGNLLTAAKVESERMPIGSHLVVANSSELIVPRHKIPDVVGNQNQTVQNVTIAPVFHVQNKEQIMNSLSQILNNSPVMSMV